MGSSVTINGRRISIDGDGDINVVSRGGEIIVNGRSIASGLSGRVELAITGTVGSVEADGSVQCGDVGGNVSAGGSVTCRDVSGQASAGGSIRASGHIKGSRISAGGSVQIG